MGSDDASIESVFPFPNRFKVLAVNKIALALEPVRPVLQLESGSPVVKKTPNTVDRHVGSRVRMRRILLGMSQEKLGEQLQLTFQQIQKYEKGMNRIGASRLQEISRILGVPVEYFFEGAPQLSEKPPVQNGFDDQGDATYVADFLATNEGVQLNRAFLKIKDPKLRRRVVELVTAIAGDDLAA